MIDVGKRASLSDGWFYLLVNDEPLIAAPCIEVCRRAARLLSEARAADYRDAMRILTKDLGFCDDRANSVFLLLQGAPPARRAVN